MKRNGWLPLLPDTITGRIIGLLFAGLILTATGSASVYMLDIFQGKGWDETARNLHRIAAIVAIMDHAPPDARVAWLSPLNETGISVAWSSTETPPPRRQDSMTRHLARDIRIFSKIQGVDRVQTGYPADAPSSTISIMPETAAAEAWIKLSDHTWLHFVIANEQISGLWTLRLVLASGLLIGGIAGLGVWAARKVTAPLAQFSLAAEHLGANVDAPPLNEEEGPEEIRQAARAFNSMQNRIRRLIEDRTLMLAALSHDLRTALTRLRFRTEFIADPQQRQKAIGDLDEMQAMLLSTLSFARDDSASEAVALIDLAMLVQSLCDDLQDAGKAVSYHGPLHMNYRGRPVSMRRALANLIDNALTYGKEASVSLAEDQDTVEITVGDRGPGIPAAMRSRVFAPFYRLESSRSRDTGGTGLGLTVARTVIHCHGGDIRLEDRSGGGLLVRITLPASTVVNTHCVES